MQHADAIRSMASEKYLLDELTPELREEFEEHFFSCPECALDMRAGAAFLEHSKVALADPTLGQSRLPGPKPRGSGLALVAAACHCCYRSWRTADCIGYQNLVTFPKTKNELADLRVAPGSSLGVIGQRAQRPGPGYGDPIPTNPSCCLWTFPRKAVFRLIHVSSIRRRERWCGRFPFPLRRQRTYLPCMFLLASEPRADTLWRSVAWMRAADHAPVSALYLRSASLNSRSHPTL